jgi:hypothetical protein
MYVVVAPSGTVTFRLDYRLNGRRETVTLGQYGPAALSLARAREKTIDARRAVMEGNSPVIAHVHEMDGLRARPAIVSAGMSG